MTMFIGSSTTAFINLWWEYMGIVVASGAMNISQLNINWERMQGFWCHGNGLYFHKV